MSNKINLAYEIQLNNGIKMPIFGLGLYQSESGPSLVELIQYAITKYNYIHFDSAKMYKNEYDVGEAIRQSGVPRHSIFVTSKLFTTKEGREGAIASIEDSLNSMKLDYIDQYLLHSPQGGRVLECYDVLLEYQQKGLIKSVGVSNFGIEHLEAMKNSSRPLPQVNQIELHPWCTQDEIVSWCRANNVAVVGYSPLTRGKKLDEPVILEMARKYGKTSAQILIRWSLQKYYVTIPKTVREQRLDENARVFDFELNDEDMSVLDEFGKCGEEHFCWNPTINNMENEFGPLC